MNLKILLLYSFVSLISIHAKDANSGHPSTVYAATWNVGEVNPPSGQSLKQLLGQISSSIEGNPDIVIVGLQEVTMNPVTEVKNNVLGDKWTKAFDNILTTANNYYKVHSESLLGILLNVYVKIKYKSLVQDKKAITVATKTPATKGAVIIKFKLKGRQYCIVNSHLPAHDGQVQDRIDNYNKIDEERSKQCGKSSDYIIWLGDLNFRLDETLDDSIIRQKIDGKKYDELLEKDELRVKMKKKIIFTDFKEQEIKFPPTFKLEKGKGTYSLQRRPAWTDRVLYKSETNKNIQPSLYKYMTEYKESDHYPVQAQLFIKDQ